MSRKTPNPESKLLANAIVGGAGLGMPGVTPPPGMAAVLLYVPIGEMLNKNIFEMQADLGLPWHAEGGDPVWFDEVMKKSVD
jgi:hypothetical protein